MTEYPISADKAATIRAQFAQRATEGRERLAQLLAVNDPLADAYKRQVESWEYMAARHYEAMPLVGTI